MWDAELSPDGTRVVIAGEDRTPRIWRLFPNMPTLVPGRSCRAALLKSSALRPTSTPPQSTFTGRRPR
jgi:hypothetical protein